jgi:hypothetical protein
MPEPLYFQWQNEILLKTIYPLREMKLRDFLVYYKEIELWAEYKNKDIASEISTYHAQKRLAVQKAIQNYYADRDYFTCEDVRADYLRKFNAVDEEALAKINGFHKTFHVNMPRFTNPRSETYFVSQQVLYWQQVRKEYVTKLASKQRRVEIMKSQVPPHPNAAKEEDELNALRDLAFPMIDGELTRLYGFVASSAKIEKRKMDLAKTVQEAEKIVQDASVKLATTKAEIEKQEVLQKQAADGLVRLKSPPDLASAETYCSTPDVTFQLRAKFPQASQLLVDSINRFHKDLHDQLSYSKADSTKLNAIKNTLYNLGQYQKSVEREILKHETDLRNMGPAWKYKTEREALRNNLRDVSLPAITEELRRLTDFQSAFEYSKKSKEEIAKMVQVAETQLAQVNARLSQVRNEAQAWQRQIDAHDDILIITEEKRLMEYVPDPTTPVTVKDIVQMKVDEYKESLAGKNAYELLELVVQKFRSRPDRFPKWLQYMVIHFSGMRYASAHGSWADPKDLLANLRLLSIDKELKGMDENAIAVLCHEKVDVYEPASTGGSVQAKTDLALTSDPDWKERLADHLKRIQRALDIDSTSYQRNALLNLRIDESNYEIDQLKPEEVYGALLACKDDLPDWMWREIVKLTDLRVNLVNDPNWEKPNPTQQAQQFSSQDNEFRQLMNNWKQKFMTGWREEHDRSDKLIVSRAVCNEVAEHIQHVRGNTPPGGLTPKPGWYQSNEAKNPGKAYFVHPTSASDFKAGASILWLRFVRKEPNAWQVAHPLSTKREGTGLLPPAFTAKRPSRAGGTTPWQYNLSDPIIRTRTVINEGGAGARQMEWLRWMHEATVVEVADTAEGTVVLTFETALPSDDPRLSSIGVFKHRLEELLSDRDEDSYYRGFVGYVPEGQVPVDHLKDMLDWDKILYKPPSA